MEKFKVKKKHLVGMIADFPLHVVHAMVNEQIKQGNKADPSIFANTPCCCKVEGGFDWSKTREGRDFWADVLRFKRFHLIPEPEKPKGHVHAKAMRQYAKDAKTSETPWDKWEFRSYGYGSWVSLDSHPRWVETVQYRRKIDTLVVTDSEEPPTPNEIVRAMLAKGMQVWAGVSIYAYDEAREQLSKHVCRVTEYLDESNFPVRTGDISWVYAVPIDLATMTEITELP